MDENVKLKKTWNSIIASLKIDEFSSQREWQKLHGLYTQKGRFYHTLSHLDFMLINLETVKHALTDKTAIWLAVFYHDAVYSTKASDNEEQSAGLANDFLQKKNRDLARNVSQLIISTKKHKPFGDDPDTSIFLDVDLLILGEPWKEYSKYSHNIRKEYFWAHEDEYHKGRSRVLKTLLQRPRIFLTEHFYKSHEKQARENMTRELRAYA